MTVVGIIAEYNPFHNGHVYQIRKVRELTGADYVIAVMSPDFVQRGAAAITDKWTRARMALSGPDHADLVLELPVCYAAGSAEYFAEGAVRLLDSLGCVDYLAFGCEADRPDLLVEAADFFALPKDREPEEYRTALQALLKEGKTYPQARAQAFLTCRASLTAGAALSSASGCQIREVFADLLMQPNNILAIEYLKAMKRFSSRMKPLPIRRMGQGYHALPNDVAGPDRAGSAFVQLPSSQDLSRGNPDGGLLNFQSARAIRSQLKEGLLPAWTLPQSSALLLQEDLQRGSLIFDEDLDLPVHLRLLRLRQDEVPCTEFLDISKDLANRIQNHINEYAGFDSFARLIKTRQMTETHVRRALIHTLLDVKTAEMQQIREAVSIPPARVLGFYREASPLLHMIRQRAAQPLLTKASGPDRILSDPAAVFMLRQTMNASDLYNALLTRRTRRAPGHPDVSHPLVII